MAFRRVVPLAIVLAIAAGAGPLRPAIAAESPRKCLTKEQQRAAVASGKAVPLALAISASKSRRPGEVVRARLCEDSSGTLVYVLTVLPRSGKVTRTVIDAANGAFAEER